MKKVLSIILLVISLVGITLLTRYALIHRGERKEVHKVVNKSPEKVGSNMTDNNLFEIYSLYLNNQKHKLKFEYIVAFHEEEVSANIDFNLYLDGKNVINNQILKGFSATNIKELFDNEEVNNIRLDDFQIIKYDNIEYILIKIKYKIEDNYKEEYFLFNDKGECLINNIIIKDSNINYISTDNIEFYYENNSLAKFEDNILYSLEYKKGVITEYKYYIKDNELVKEELNKYNNIKKN